MKTVTLNLVDHSKTEEAQRDLDGLQVFASSFCPKHKVGLIIAYDPSEGEMDMLCAQVALVEMSGKIMETVLAAQMQQAEKAEEN